MKVGTLRGVAMFPRNETPISTAGRYFWMDTFRVLIRTSIFSRDARNKDGSDPVPVPVPVPVSVINVITQLHPDGSGFVDAP